MPDWLLLTIKIASGPVVGAIIGFFTNWLAVKMLFRPYKAKHIGKLRIPFTPGIIPKRKTALANALGKVVGTKLITTSDLNRLFTSDSIKEKIGLTVSEAVFGVSDEVTARSVIDGFGEGNADKVRDKASGFITNKMLVAVKKLDLPELITTHAGDALSSVGGIASVIGMFGGNKLMTKLASVVGEKLEKYIEENGYDLVCPIVKEEIDKILNSSLSNSVAMVGVTRDKIASLAVSVYEKYAVEKISEFVAGFDIASIVRQKVDDMSMKEIEDLFMTVMKKELSAIVNLGGILGLLVGGINSLINIFLL